MQFFKIIIKVRLSEKIQKKVLLYLSDIIFRILFNLKKSNFINFKDLFSFLLLNMFDK